MSAEQSDAQSIPPTLDVTAPAAAPVTNTFAVNTQATGENPAVTDLAAVIDNVQEVDVPEHEPLQPVKTEPAAGVAVKVTDEPCSRFAEHDEPQSTPPTLDVIVPDPEPAFATDNTQELGENPAVTDRAAFIDTVQVVAVPEHEPAQPVKTEPSPGVAVNVTDVP